jgi:DNA-binding NarL/FixJ family response regulator
MTFYVIDDHPLMREAMVMLLRRLRPGADVVEVSHLGKFAPAVQAHGEPELICLDLKLPDTLGVSGVRDIRAVYPHTPLAVISSEPAAQCEEPCIEAGADIYIEKSAGATEISAALKTLLTAESELEQEEGSDGTQTKLSKRQKQLILMLDQGLSNRDIAETLGISEHTVKVHLWRLFKRIGVNSRTQMLHYARVNGLLIN